MPDQHAFSGEVAAVTLPFVSIIIPVKNEEKHIGRCLQALQALNYPDDKYEVIVVDNGSTDTTVAIASAAPKVRVLISTGNIGAVRNLGAKHGRGEVLAFLDGDCLVPAEWLNIALGTLCEKSNTTVCSAVLALEDRQQAPWVERYWIDYLNSKYHNTINIVPTISSFCFLVRRQSMAEVGWFNETLETCEDSDLGFRLARDGRQLLSDRRIEVIHLGNAKTLRQFFLRQLWQGRANLKGLSKHGFELQEVPSVLVPILYLLGLAALPVMLITAPAIAVFALLLALLLIPLVKATQSSHLCLWRMLPGYGFLWFVYLSGRGFGTLVKIGRTAK